jgi:hypothetical protein
MLNWLEFILTVAIVRGFKCNGEQTLRMLVSKQCAKGTLYVT